jgi:hypothetical protein
MNPSSSSRTPSPALSAGLALLLFVIALLGFGAALGGFSHALHPVALLGARGIPRWWLFDVLGFVLPGLLMAWAMWRTGLAWERRHEDSGAIARIGWTLCTMSALAFALQGVLPVDPAKGLSFGIGRLHTAAWTVWWIAYVSGAVALALGAPARMRARGALSLVVAAVVVALSMSALIPAAPAMGQRIAFVAWFAWAWWMARGASR